MVREVNLHQFAEAHTGGAFVLDVRETAEYVAGHVPGAKLVPLRSVRARLGEVPRGERVYVICASGNRSLTAASWLTAAGHDAVSVAGGTTGWLRSGRVVVHGLSEHAVEESR